MVMRRTVAIALVLAVLVATPAAAGGGGGGGSDRAVRAPVAPATGGFGCDEKMPTRCGCGSDRGLRPGQSWQLFISDNGTRIFSAPRSSTSQGEIRVDKNTRDPPAATTSTPTRSTARPARPAKGPSRSDEVPGRSSRCDPDRPTTKLDPSTGEPVPTEEGMHMISKILRVALAAGLALSLAGAAARPRQRGRRDPPRQLLRLERLEAQALARGRRIEVEFEVDSNVVGQTWQVRLTKNGNQIFSGSRVTRGASGSFELRRVTSDPAGDDVFRARATHAGEVCAGQRHLLSSTAVPPDSPASASKGARWADWRMPRRAAVLP